MNTKKRERDLLRWAALIAALVVTMQGEYALAVSAGFNRYVAVGVPAALDIYAVRALRAHRDITAVVVAMITVNSLSHLVAAHLLPVSVALVIAVSAIAPLVVWRVHALADAKHPNPEAESGLAAANRSAEVPNPAEVQVPPIPASLVPNPAPEPGSAVVPNLPEPHLNQVPNQLVELQVNQVSAGSEPASEPVAEPVEPGRPNLTRNQPKKTTSKPAAAAKPTNPGTPSVSAQVAQILDLITEHGYETVTLGFVREQTGLSKTTAYNRLVEARATWSETNEQDSGS